MGRIHPQSVPSKLDPKPLHVPVSCRKVKRAAYSRRRRHQDDKDVDSINNRNEHFNRKLERAYGAYTQEIKANLERGTALPDH